KKDRHAWDSVAVSYSVGKRSSAGKTPLHQREGNTLTTLPPFRRCCCRLLRFENNNRLPTVLWRPDCRDLHFFAFHFNFWRESNWRCRPWITRSPDVHWLPAAAVRWQNDGVLWMRLIARQRVVRMGHTFLRDAVAWINWRARWQRVVDRMLRMRQVTGQRVVRVCT